MPKSTTSGNARPSRHAFRCGECGWESLKWVGRCGECQAWGTIEQPGLPRLRSVAATSVTEAARPIGEIDAESARSQPTGVDELDRVLGGGLVPGVVVLLAGEPGVGKSTLVLEVASKFATPGTRTLYITGEESTAQVRLRAGRIKALSPDLFLAAETDIGAVLKHLDDVGPSLLIVDSVQTMAIADVDGSAGGVTQVRQVAAALIAVAKERGIATVLVGHVTKDGSIAGPRVLEHLVDVVLQFEGERHSRLRLVRAIKNRYGACDEVGCFDLTEEGIVGLADPSGLFLSRRSAPVSGTCITVALEGRRPLVAEVQALVAKSNMAIPRRTTSGLDAGRVSMVLAVTERRAKILLTGADVFTATVGGVKLTEPAGDLAVALAVASAENDKALLPGLVAIGEVGLAGEVRRVEGVGRRLIEAARLGFTHALVPPDSGPVPPGVHSIEVSDLAQAIEYALATNG
ncbi:MAG TPA: DNA repair protein RadA [Acidothermaceae bacterium]